jgi:hypothetical protein
MFITYIFVFYKCKLKSEAYYISEFQLFFLFIQYQKEKEFINFPYQLKPS